MLDINKQDMKYSRQGEKVTIYDRDENGEIKYIEMDGERIPVVLRETTGYSEPVLFSANISNKLSEVLVKEFGIDDSSSYCQIVTDKGYLPIKAGDVIWKKSEVGRDDDGLVDSKTADFSSLIENRDAYIATVVHKTFIEVDEKGTRAAASTLVGADTMSLMEPYSVFLNRPFVYMIVDTETNLPLFIGVQTEI